MAVRELGEGRDPKVAKPRPLLGEGTCLSRSRGRQPCYVQESQRFLGRSSLHHGDPCKRCVVEVVLSLGRRSTSGWRTTSHFPRHRKPPSRNCTHRSSMYTHQARLFPYSSISLDPFPRHLGCSTWLWIACDCTCSFQRLVFVTFVRKLPRFRPSGVRRVGETACVGLRRGARPLKLRFGSQKARASVEEAL